MTIQSKRLPVLVAVSVLLWGCGAAAQALPGTAPAIDLSTAVRLALDQPGLRAAAHEVAASEAAAGQAGLLPNPELAWLREGQQAGARTTTVQVNQAIELGGKRQARVALARGEAALARGELAARRQEMRAEAIAGYYAVLVAQERLGLARSLAELARKSVEVAARRVAAGKASPIDETKARLAAVDAATEASQAGAELAIARARLGALIGRPADAIHIADDQAERLPEAQPLEALLAAAGDAAPVLQARSQVAVREAQADVERAARVPDVTVSLGSQRDDQAGRSQAVVGLSVPLPLFDRNQGRLAAALRRTDKAREELAAVRVSVAAELAAAHARYQAARSEAVLLRQDVIPNASSAYELTLKGFEYGKFAFLDVLDAQRTWFQAQSRRWNAVREAWRAYADIERLTGAAQQDNRKPQ